MILGGRWALSGRADDYTDPLGAVAFALIGALREYASKGGDLENVQLTVCIEPMTAGRMSRKVTTVRLDGYEKEGGGDAAV